MLCLNPDATWVDVNIHPQKLEVRFSDNKRVYELIYEAVAEALRERGCGAVAVHDLARGDMAEAVADAFRYNRVVLATTTYNADLFPFMKEFIQHLTERNFQNRTVGLMENGSWAPTAAKGMKALLEGCKNLTFCENQVKILSALSPESREQVRALAAELQP